MVSLRGLMFCRRSKFSIRRTPKFLTWNGRSPKKKTPSASSLATTRRPCLWDARWWSSRFLPKRSEEHTSELQSRLHLVCRLLLEKKKNNHLDMYVTHHDCMECA